MRILRLELQYIRKLDIFLVLSSPAIDCGAMRTEMARTMNTRGSACTLAGSIALVRSYKSS